MKMLFVWLWFLLGVLLCVFMQAQIRVDSPLNGYRNIAHYYGVNFWRIAGRTFVASMVFWGIASGHGQFSVFLPDSSWDLRLPFLAGLSGFAADSGLSKIAALLGLEKIIPPIGGSITKVEETAVVTTEETTKTTTTVDNPVVKKEKP